MKALWEVASPRSQLICRIKVAWNNAKQSGNGIDKAGQTIRERERGKRERAKSNRIDIAINGKQGESSKSVKIKGFSQFKQGNLTISIEISYFWHVPLYLSLSLSLSDIHVCLGLSVDLGIDFYLRRRWPTQLASCCHVLHPPCPTGCNLSS